jgi:AmmeMemoRadiSam system protein A
MFTLSQRHTLLSLARQAIVTAVTEGRLLVPLVEDPALQQALGAFVTLTMAGELRGCIGFIEPRYPLYETVARGGAAAALHDPRFPPVQTEELATLAVEISVLSPLAPALPESVRVGVHGLVVEQGAARGLLLPQVAVEWGWEREEFLAQTCRKAGLPLDAWRHGATLYTFSAEVFNEQTLAMASLTGDGA